MKAWAIKDEVGIAPNEAGIVPKVYKSEFFAERIRCEFYPNSQVVPVEITEIAEADTVESKEPDWKAMWDELSRRIDHDYEPHHFIRFLKNSIINKHTPREETTEEKLAEAEKKLRALERALILNADCGWDNAVSKQFRNLVDLCK